MVSALSNSLGARQQLCCPSFSSGDIVIWQPLAAAAAVLTWTAAAVAFLSASAFLFWRLELLYVP
jgi:hypothetical protein